MNDAPASAASTSGHDERRLQLLVAGVDDCVVASLDASGVITSWNQGGERLLGFTASEIVGLHVSVLFPPEELARGACDRLLLSARSEGRAGEHGSCVRKGRPPLWAKKTLHALVDEGRFLGFGLYVSDETREAPGSEALRQSEERFRLLVEHCTDYAIFMLDPRGYVVTWNAGAERIKRYTASQIVGRHFSAFYTIEDVRAGKCERALSDALRVGRVEAEGYRVRGDGTRFWANIVLTPMRDNDGHLLGFAKITRDLTERKRAEEERLHLVQMQQTNRLKDEFVATISHELRTPLHAILGWANLLIERVSDVEARKAAETILRNAQMQAHIIDDVLDVSRIITGKLKLELDKTDLVATVRDALEVVRPSASARDVQLAFEHDEQAYDLVADPTRLSQVVWNLLSNAVKFSSSGGSVTARLRRDGARIELSVHDTGQGIDPDFLPYVFDRFRQGEGSTRRKFGGLGLGLAIVREIVAMHGGEVRAESPGVGLGAAFHVSLPIRALRPSLEEERSSPRTVREAPCLSTRLEGLRVLVVDDEPDARELLAELLEARGAESFSAAGAEEGRRALSIAKPHVIISDIAMPHEDGYDFIKSVRSLATEQGGTTPAIALTAHARREDRVRALGAGFTSYLQKPVDVEELVQVIHGLSRPLARRAPA